jgi:peptidoglycan/xylan/chitin deacetylase (PgdA/CDA1 family)
MLAVTAARAVSPGEAADLPQRCWTAEELRTGTGPAAVSPLPPDPAVTTPVRRQPLPEALRGSIRSVLPASEEKAVALTFDLCEGARELSGYDAALVDFLRQNGVRATFFAGGRWLRDHREPALQLIADPLFEVGSHSWSHPDFRTLTPAQRAAEVEQTQAEYARLRRQLLARPCASGARVPLEPALFRFPYGRCDQASLDALAAAGLPAIQWNVVTGDPAKGQTAAAIARTVLEQVRPGAIVIAHANGRGWHTAEALRTVVPELRREGYRFVTVSELLALGAPVRAQSCYESRLGDHDRVGTAKRENGR